MYLKKLFAPVVGLIVADVVSAVQKLVLANLSPRKRGAGIRFTPRRVNRSLHSQSKKVNMSMLKNLVASLVGLNPAGAWSAAKMQSLLLTLTLIVTVLCVGPAAVAAEKKMVKDPATGKMVVAPRYGGTFTYIRALQPANIDSYYRYTAGLVVGGVNERLGVSDWALDRSKFDFTSLYTPDFAITGGLAESWEQPDPLTIIFKIRQGVHWHKKAPMRGRALTAKDIEFNFHRVLALGSGFTELSPDVGGYDLGRISFESITANDDSTVVFKLKEPFLFGVGAIAQGAHAFILAPEVIQQHGNVSDWQNVVGTGPFELTDLVEGSSITFSKNPNYWGHDEKYSQNRLPYVDEMRSLISNEVATNLALLRSGKVDYIGYAGDSHLSSVDQVTSLQRTNPELVVHPFSYRAETALNFDTQIEPWNDVRVRRAVSMAIDFETINKTYLKGWADTKPAGWIGKNVFGYYVPFEEWSEETKQYYRYDPKGAEKLLDEAGYPQGADGVRFKTTYDHYEFFDLNYYEIAMSYLEAIGIDVEIALNDRATNIDKIREHKYKGLISGVTNMDWSVVTLLNQMYSEAGWAPSNVNDPAFDKLYEAVKAATTVEEQKKWVREADMMIVEQVWQVFGPRVPLFQVTQPWVIGFNGEIDLGPLDRQPVFARLWIDQDLKNEMGQ